MLPACAIAHPSPQDTIGRITLLYTVELQPARMFEHGLTRDWSAATNFRRPVLPVFPNCSDWSPLTQGWPSFVAYYYPSNSDYDQWHGQDLTPWNQAYAGRGPAQLLVGPVNRMEKRLVDLRYQSCSEQVEHTGSWRVDRVGPFTTQGGNAWWQMSGRDALRLSQTPLGSGGHVFITESFLGPVDDNNIFIPLPILHIHHVHLFKGLNFPRQKPVAPMYLYLLNTRAIESAGLRPVVLEHHSEAMYNDPDGSDVHSEAEPVGYGILVDTALDMTLEFNDYRPRHSAPIDFYVQLALKCLAPFQNSLIPVTRHAPVGVVGFGGEFYGHQLPLGGYRWGNEPCVMWSSQVVLASYQVVAIKHHNHLSFTHRAFLLRNASPAELGLQRQNQVTVAEGVSFLRDVGRAAPQSVKDYRASLESQTLPLRLSGFVDFDAFERQLRKQAKEKLACVLYPVWITVGGEKTDTFGQQTCWPALPWKVHNGERWTHVLLAKPIHGVFAIHSSWYISAVLSGASRTCPGFRLPCTYLHPSTSDSADGVLSVASPYCLAVSSCFLVAVSLLLGINAAHSVLL